MAAQHQPARQILVICARLAAATAAFALAVGFGAFYPLDAMARR